MTLLLETSWEFETAVVHLRKLLSQLRRCQICHVANDVMQDFTTFVRLGEHGLVLKPHELTREASAALNLLDKLFFTLPSTPENDAFIKHLALSVGVWIARNGGELQELSLLVNAVATLANQSKQQHELESLYEASLYVLTATDTFIKADTDKRDTMRPWRLLNLNHCIIATRTNHPELIKKAYAQLIQALPEEAPRFFAMAQRKVQAAPHPAHIRHLVAQYQQLFTEQLHSPSGATLALH